VDVKAGSILVVPLELVVAEVSSSVTVTASGPVPALESAQHNTINQSVVENAPNHTERFESLLPLVLVARAETPQTIPKEKATD
jgi:hypothetical protein